MSKYNITVQEREVIDEIMEICRGSNIINELENIEPEEFATEEVTEERIEYFIEIIIEEALEEDREQGY